MPSEMLNNLKQSLSSAAGAVKDTALAAYQPIKETIDNAYTPEQQNDLKTLAISALAAGAGIPLLRHVFGSGKTQALPSSGSGLNLSLPVPEEEMLGALPSSKMDSSNVTGRAKDLRNFVPSKKLKEKKATVEKTALEWGDLTNPYYLPAVVAAASVPMIAGNRLVKSLINKKNEIENEDEEQKAKDQFAKTLFEAHSNRLGRPIKAASFNADVATFSSDLEKLACIYESQKFNMDKAAQDNYAVAIPSSPGKPPAHYTPPEPGDGWFASGLKSFADYVGEAAKLSGEKLLGAGLGAGKYVWDSVAPVLAPAFKGIGGGALAAGLLSGGLGTYYGHSMAKRQDKETEDSYKYLAEFLRRQQEQGTPVYVTPTPVAKKKPWYSIS